MTTQALIDTYYTGLARREGWEQTIADDFVFTGAAPNRVSRGKASYVEAVRRYAHEHDLDYRILLGSPEVIRAYRVNVFPTNYFLNGDGSIDRSSVGLSTRLGLGARLWLADAGGVRH